MIESYKEHVKNVIKYLHITLYYLIYQINVYFRYNCLDNFSQFLKWVGII